MEKRYSIFVSSTYVDLFKQRKTLNEFLLKSNYIPLIMENFGSSSKPSIKVIKDTLKITDYYILIVAGLYGSIVPSKNISYTENEFDIAHELGIPVLSFIYIGDLPDEMKEKNEEKLLKLQNFIEKIKNQHNVTIFEDFELLPAFVLASLTNEISSNPRDGWMRGIEYKREKYKEYWIGLNFKKKSLIESDIETINTSLFEFNRLLFPVDLNTPVRPIQIKNDSLYYSIRFVVEAKNPQIAEIRRHQFETEAKKFKQYANSFLRDFDGYEKSKL